MRWWIARTLALPVKLLLLAWVLLFVASSVYGEYGKIMAAAMVTMAVLGVLLTVVVFPLLCALIIGSVVAFGTPLVIVPRLWRTPRSGIANFALTIGIVVGSALAGSALHEASVKGIAWIADRDPCVALRAGVTGSKPPSEADCPSLR